MKTSQNIKKKKLRQGKVLTQYMQRKLAVTVMIIMLALIALIAVIYYIVRNNNEDYNRIVLSQRQASYDSRTIPFRRGNVMDRNGTVLATSQKVYNLIIDPAVILSSEDGWYLSATVSALSEYFGYSASELTTLINERSTKNYVRYDRQLSYDDKAGFVALMEDKNKAYRAAGSNERVKGVWFEDEYKRVYPYNSLACNIIGFSSADGSTGTGGVEQYYNDTLTGVNGREYGYLDEDTKLQSVIKEPTDGNSIVTTINTNIQMTVEKYLNEWENEDVGSLSASCIVMDPKTGEVLAMASTNQYDLNNPRDLQGKYTNEELMALGRKEAVGVYKRENPDAAPITEDQVSEYYTQDDILSYGTQVAWNQMWRNIPVSDTYEPGSTAKVFTVAGALEENLVSPASTFDCEGYIQLSDGINTWRIRCNNRNGHGILDLQHSLMQSCNMAMADIAFTEGAETFVKYLKVFGLGQKTGIDLPAEADTAGLIYEAEDLGRTTLATNSFGQNYNVTMIQMAAAYSSILNGGSYYKPHVVKQILNANGTVIQDVQPELIRTTASKATCDFLKEALFQTVANGTGKLAQIQGYEVGGKTGTAQKLPRSAKNYLVSFCGFAPVDDPQLLVYVVVDQPNLEGEAQATASFATKIFQKIMNDSLQYLNIYPSGETDPEASINAGLPAQEGIGSETMGNQVTTETDANGETIPAETDADGNPVPQEGTEAVSTAPAETDEFVEPGEDLGIPEAVPGTSAAGVQNFTISNGTAAAVETSSLAETETGVETSDVGEETAASAEETENR